MSASNPQPARRLRRTIAAPLDRLIAEASVLAGGEHPCAVLGHKWAFIGGASRTLSDGSYCSVPVYECEACGDCDYGENTEAAEIVAAREEGIAA